MVVEVSKLKKGIEHSEVKLHSPSRPENLAQYSAKKNDSHMLPRALHFVRLTTCRMEEGCGTLHGRAEWKVQRSTTTRIIASCS